MMLELLTNILVPYRHQHQTKAEITIPVLVVAFFSVVSAAPMKQMHGWIIGGVSFIIAFAVLCLLRKCYVEFAADPDGHISPSILGLIEAIPLNASMLLVAVWLAICIRILGWQPS